MPDRSQLDFYENLAGVDEAGRGPLAGPVVAAAVILDKNNPVSGLSDSKKITHQNRMFLATEIKSRARAWATGRAEVNEIDDLNILNASLLAMKRAVESLTITPDKVVVDGNFVPEIDIDCEAIIKGDNLVAAISAASIIAKTTRDLEMMKLDERFPGYGFSSHKGYPTKQHIESLNRLGISAIHRRSFSPVSRLIK